VGANNLTILGSKLGTLTAKEGYRVYNNNPEARNKDRKNEPQTIATTTSGTHPAGNYGGPGAQDGISLPPPEKAAEIWIEKEDQAKQGMARKFDLKGAQAAPGRPHLGHAPGSGEAQ